MSRYAAGRRKEWAARDQLAKTARLVLRSAGSKGLVDLVAIFGLTVCLVQVKYTRKAGNAWADKNWRALVKLQQAGRFPENVRAVAYVYRFGKLAPEIHSA
jgi:Holliday junction resolvase